jgi:serine acetyltransferase
VVIEDVADGVTVAGVPARVIKIGKATSEPVSI